jgi:hypothetical protein
MTGTWTLGEWEGKGDGNREVRLDYWTREHELTWTWETAVVVSRLRRASPSPPFAFAEVEVVVADVGSRRVSRRWRRRPSLRTGLLVMPEETKRGAAPGFVRANEAWQQGQNAPMLRVSPGNERPTATPGFAR